MKITKRVYSHTVGMSRDYQSIKVTNGLEVEVDNDNAKDIEEFELEKVKVTAQTRTEARIELRRLIGAKADAYDEGVNILK